MAKSIFVFILLVMLLRSTASPQAPGGTIPDTEVTFPDASEPTETVFMGPEELPLPQDSMEFTFSSGAGGWRTVITVDRSGYFSGRFTDSNMGECSEEYPNGTVYICEFSGAFEDIEKISQYEYKMTLSHMHIQQDEAEWISDGIRYVASGPYGLDDPETGGICNEYILYLPDTPIDGLSDDFMLWWPYRFDMDATPDTLACYGIMNVTANYGFFCENNA